jgi:hypothetical protein
MPFEYVNIICDISKNMPLRSHNGHKIISFAVHDSDLWRVLDPPVGPRRRRGAHQRQGEFAADSLRMAERGSLGQFVIAVRSDPWTAPEVSGPGGPLPEHPALRRQAQEDLADGLEVDRPALALLGPGVDVAQPALERVLVEDRIRAGGTVDGGDDVVRLMDRPGRRKYAAGPADRSGTRRWARPPLPFRLAKLDRLPVPSV